MPALVASIRNTTPNARILFIADKNDGPEQDAISQADCEWISGSNWKTYAQKINAGVRYTDGAWIAFAADDLIFLPGWCDEIATVDYNNLATSDYPVIGLNDGIPRPDRPTHATHFLVTRAYAELPCVDGSPGPLYEGYRHWYTDDEFIATARARGCYGYAADARIEHHHPVIGGVMDAIYRVGYEHAEADAAIFASRRHLWGSR